MIGSMSQGQPARWTATIALVRGVTTAEIVSAEILPLARSTSAKTGLAPALATQEIDAMKVRGVTITSSSALPPLALPTPSPCNARSSATVPLATAMAWLLSDQEIGRASCRERVCQYV